MSIISIINNQIIELKNGGIGQIGTYEEVIINKI